MKRVVVTGVGLVTPLCVGRERTWSRLLAGETGLGRIRGFDASRLPSRVAAEVPKIDESRVREDRGLAEDELFDAGEVLGTTSEEARKTPNFISYALAAAREALADAAWEPRTEEECQNSGVSIGVGMTSLAYVVDAAKQVDSSPAGYRRVSPFFIPRALPNLAAGHVSIKHKLQGPSLCPTTACAAGAHAIGDGMRMIQTGSAKVMVVGGSEAAIDELGVVGFSRLRALSSSFNDDPQKASRPFDVRRDGFVMGEGSGVMVLEELEHAKARSARVYAEVAGIGMSSDAYHITSPVPDGAGALRAMRIALDSANCVASDIGYINAHATSTPLGDRAENSAIQELFPQKTLVSSTKGAIGHLLGAAGAVEAAFTVLAISSGMVPPTVNLEEPDEGFLMDYVAQKGRPTIIQHAMSNSFGFGGTNVSLLFKQLDR